VNAAVVTTVAAAVFAFIAVAAASVAYVAVAFTASPAHIITSSTSFTFNFTSYITAPFFAATS
jgi:hypothetical protein